MNESQETPGVIYTAVQKSSLKINDMKTFNFEITPEIAQSILDGDWSIVPSDFSTLDKYATVILENMDKAVIGQPGPRKPKGKYRSIDDPWEK